MKYRFKRHITTAALCGDNNSPDSDHTAAHKGRGVIFGAVGIVLLAADRYVENKEVTLKTAAGISLMAAGAVLVAIG